MSKKESAARLDHLRSLDFIKLETEYQQWFDDRDSLIEEYFVDQDFSKGFVKNCELPEIIQNECRAIISRYNIDYSNIGNGAVDI